MNVIRTVADWPRNAVTLGIETENIQSGLKNQFRLALLPCYYGAGYVFEM